MANCLAYCIEEPDASDSDDLRGFSTVAKHDDISSCDSGLALSESARNPFVLYNVFLVIASSAATVFGLFSFVMEVSARLDNRLSICTIGISMSVFLFGAASLICCTLGYFAVRRRLLQHLKLYRSVLGVFIMLEITIAALGIIQQSLVKMDTQNITKWSIFIEHYQDDTIRDDLDSIQTQLKCCGFKGYSDWEANPYYSCKSTGYSRCSVPASCCKVHGITGSSCVLGVRHPSKTKTEIGKFIHLQGCLDAIEAWYKYTLILLSFALVFIAIIQLIIRHYSSTLIQELHNQQTVAESVGDSASEGNILDEENIQTSSIEVSKVSRQQNINTIVLLDNHHEAHITQYIHPYLYKIPVL